MNSGFVKNILLSFSIAGGLIIIVDIIVKRVIQAKIVSPTQDVKQPLAIKSVKIKPKAEAFKASEAISAKNITSLLATCDPKAGKKAFRRCQVCYTTEKGGKNRVGPNLWNVVGRKKSGIKDFKYSDSMRQKGGTWTFTDLDAFLHYPKVFVMGTRMSVKGYKDPLDPINLINYLRTLSDDTKASAD